MMLARSGTATLVVAALAVSLALAAESPENGRDVYGPCAACHGAHGEGGKHGEYPRIAGQPPQFIVAQLRAFQAHRRYNVAMFPYTEPRELTESDMEDVAAFLSRIELPAKAPVFKDSDSALDRLLAMEKVLVVPRVEGDVEKGHAVFKQRCSACHGRGGRGRKTVPGLVGQYPEYLRRQVDVFLKNGRPHDKKDGTPGVFTKVTPEDTTNILAWLTSIQDQDPIPDGSSPTAPE